MAKFWRLLCAKRTLAERNEIIKKYASVQDINQKIIAIEKEYRLLYGVKNSSFNFMRSVMTKDNQQKILRNISVSEIIKEAERLEKRFSAPTTKILIDVSDDFKKEFLFKVRNQFTHHGIAVGTSITSTKEIEEMKEALQKEKGRGILRNHFYAVFEEVKGDKTYVYSITENFHQVLMDVILDTKVFTAGLVKF